MLSWFSANLSTIVISLLLLAVIFLIVRHLIRQRKQESTPAVATAVPAAPVKAATANPELGKLRGSPPPRFFVSRRISTLRSRVLKFIFCS